MAELRRLPPQLRHDRPDVDQSPRGVQGDQTGRHGLLVANLTLLLGITFLPFPTKVTSEAFGHGSADDRRAAIVFYGLWGVFIAVGYISIWLWASRDTRLIDPRVSAKSIQARTRRYLPGIPIYAAATIVGLVNAYAGLIALCAIAVFFRLPYGSEQDAEALTGTAGR